MTTSSGRRGEPVIGRPKDLDRTEAILASASLLLFKKGYDRLRVQEVAERAGVGTGAIYRRWETKEALVAEAIRSGPDPSPQIEPAEDPAVDLRAEVEAKADLASARPDLLPGLIAAMQVDTMIDAAMRERYSIESVRHALARVLGDDHPHLEILAEIVPAVALHRSALRSRPFDPALLTEQLLALITDLVSLPDLEGPTDV